MIGFTSNAPARRQRGRDDSLPARTVLLLGLGRLTPGFVAALEAEGIHTFAAEDAPEAYRLAEQVQPDLMLLSREGGEAEGLPLLRALRCASPGSCILYLLDGLDRERAVAALEAGADDVVPPPHTAATVLLRAHVLRERPFLRNTEAHRLGASLRVERLSRTLTDPEGSTSLTGREFELLERLVEARGRVVPREHLLRDIWGSDQDSEAVLDATVHRLRKKLERNPSNPDILTTVRGIGYRLEDARVEIADA